MECAWPMTGLCDGSVCVLVRGECDCAEPENECPKTAVGAACDCSDAMAASGDWLPATGAALAANCACSARCCSRVRLSDDASWKSCASVRCNDCIVTVR